MNQPSFEDILEACLQAVLERGEAVETVLARRPEEAARLRPLLQAALTLRSAVPPFPTRSFTRQRVLRAMARPRPRPTWTWRWAAVPLAAILALLVAGSSTVLAASDSAPGAVLYPVKMATERVRVALARGDVPRARLELRLAEERLEEMESLTREGKTERVREAARRLDRHLWRFGTLAHPGDKAALAELAALLAQGETEQWSRLKELQAGAPLPARQALAEAAKQALLRWEENWKTFEEFLPPPGAAAGPAPGFAHPPVFWMGVVDWVGEGRMMVRGQPVPLAPELGEFKAGQRILFLAQMQPDGSLVVLEARRVGWRGGPR